MDDGFKIKTVQDYFEELTAEHRRQEPDPETGELMWRVYPGMLAQLREEITGGMESTGGGSGSKTKLPIAAGALDLFTMIDEQIAEVWSEAFAGQVPNADRAEGLLAQVVAVAADDEQFTVTHSVQDRDGDRYYVRRTALTKNLRGHLASWANQIRDFFDPPRTARVGYPCPTCGENKLHSFKDGDLIESDALVFIRDAWGTTQAAKCMVCSAWWHASVLTTTFCQLLGIGSNTSCETVSE